MSAKWRKNRKKTLTILLHQEMYAREPSTSKRTRVETHAFDTAIATAHHHGIMTREARTAERHGARPIMRLNASTI